MPDEANLVKVRQVHVGLGELWALGGALAYALTNVFSRIASTAVDPIVAPIFRLLPTLTISWMQVGRARQRWSALQPSSPGFVGWRTIAILFLGGALSTTIGTVFFFFALQIGGVVLTAPVLATNILWSTIIAALFLKESLNTRMITGVVVAVLGVALLGIGRTTGSAIVPEELSAIPLALITAMSWAVSVNCTRYALVRGVDKYLAISVSQTFGILLLIGVAFIMGRGPLLWTTAFGTIGVLLLAGILSASALIFDAQALSLTTVASVLTIGGLNPVISTILAALFLGEELRLLMAVGTVMTVVGVIIVQLSKEQTP